MNTRTSRFVAIALLLLCATFLSAAKASDASDDEKQAFEAALATLCDKRVVLLGEDSGHGAGRTVALKGRITRALVERCGFSAVYFESPVYEFLHLEEQLAARDAGPGLLADAVGALWAGTAEFQPTLDWLWQDVVAGRLHVQGLDVQVGGITQTYSAQALPARLARHAGRSRTMCERRIARFTRWEFDATHPFDDAFRTQVRACLATIQTRLASDHDTVSSKATARMTWALMRALDVGSHDGFNLREDAMARNVAWHQARVPAPRIVIWTATRHALKGVLADKPERIPLGMRLVPGFGPDLASIGFTSASGHHGRPGQGSLALNTPTLGTLEAAPHASRSSVFLDVAQLHRLGTRESRVVGYARPLTADWSTLLDGIWILPLETPLHVAGDIEVPPAPALPLM
ncbi:Erythromycin esterase homolog [Pseudoxanthomonas sp. CF385]|uniref:erythromycin esterase family protein n=1 Tax=Pseudoxanthomonas sp. CF385 TaxID=1881042 RepID=UPI000880BB68|nr:erythromycin esterase family protein [Pseudoxanthomonas sp. CF385]SDQ54235.1 Erythromycin esterase homolog [Pseudoxanthomonas sp. CF385]